MHTGKVAAVLSSALPITQLWKIELNNKKLADSKGFDEYMLWAIICTIPLLTHRALKAYRAIEKRVYEGELRIENKNGGQIFTVGTSILAEVARFFIYSKSVSELSKQTGLEDIYCDIIGYIAGGLVASSVIGMMEYSSLKSLFEKQHTKLTNTSVVVAIGSAIEAAWFTLPLMSTGIKALEKWGSFFKAIVLTPLFVSHTAKEGCSMYNSIMYKKQQFRRPQHNMTV